MKARQRRSRAVTILTATFGILSPYALAQVDWTWNATGLYNNSTSALIGTMIQQNMNMLGMHSLSNQTTKAVGNGIEASNQAQLQRGQQIIKAGKATTLFKPIPFTAQYAEWAKNDGTSVERKKWEYAEQMKIWNEAAKRYGANLNDYAHIQALAGLVAYEGYTGLRPSQNAWKAQAAAVRNVLLNDPYWQGMTNQVKAERANDLSLSGYSVFERQEHQRTGDKNWLERAKVHASSTLGRLWRSTTQGLSVAEDFVRVISKYGSTLAPVIARWNKPTPYANVSSSPASPVKAVDPVATAPSLTIKEAIARTTFRRSTDTVVPAQMAKLAKTPQEAQQIKKLVTQFITMAREQLAENRAAEMPVDNVARVTAYAFGYLYLIGSATPGQAMNDIPTPITTQKLVSLSRKVALGLASQPNFLKLSDLEKQQYAEMLLLMPTFLAGAYSVAQEEGNVDMQRGAIEMARGSFKEIFGVLPQEFDFSGL